MPELDGGEFAAIVGSICVMISAVVAAIFSSGKKKPPQAEPPKPPAAPQLTPAGRAALELLAATPPAPSARVTDERVIRESLERIHKSLDAIQVTLTKVELRAEDGRRVDWEKMQALNEVRELLLRIEKRLS